MKYFNILLLSLFFLFSACQKENEKDVDSCESVVCQNGSSCYDETCYCLDFYYGPNCEHPMTGFIIDSIVIQCNTLYDDNGDLIEGTGEGNPDLVLDLFQKSSFPYTRIHTSAVNHEVPISTKSTFYSNWHFSTGAFETSYLMKLKDYDAGSSASYDLIREIDFTFDNINGQASQMIDARDGQFTATLYYSYQ